MPKPDRLRVSFTFEVLPCEDSLAKPWTRVRVALKRLLRDYGLKWVGDGCAACAAQRQAIAETDVEDWEDDMLVMTRFKDGPAIGQVLHLRRSPAYLRVVRGANGEYDALDQLDDAPAADEAVWAYRLTLDGGVVHVDYRDEKGRRRGAWYRCATYSAMPDQPDEATLRDTARWRAWAVAKLARNKREELMPDMTRGVCRSCGQPVLWVRTAATGSLMPLDPEPPASPIGNVALDAEGRAEVLAPLMASAHAGPLYRSHFATCPQAAAHRKAR